MLALVLLPAPSAAQIWRSQEGRHWSPIRRGLPEKRRGFVFCRLWYDAVRSMPSGLGWSTDYPAADANLVTRLEELTPIHVSRWKDGDPGIAAMRATDPDIFQCPFLFMSDPGSVRFSQEEIEGLRDYLTKGGFLWADDLWGEQAWRYFEEEIKRVLPDYPIVEIEPGHPLLSNYYMVEEIPQIPSFQSWRRSGGRTSEFGSETAVPHIRAIFDHEGRLLVVISHNTDIADGWEREADSDPEFFYNFSPEAYGVAINILYWAMSH
ncbi:MAG TPA: DUF4159 domain-containing protein [Longimicrobiales bacterium]|nr:DUF4159 domain-containing protein [Longimicrobiales bacterium]